MHRAGVVFLFCLSMLFQNISGQNDPMSNENAWLGKLLNLPIKNFTRPAKQIVIAIIDDGFRFTHKDLEDFIFHNPDEIPGNFIDDDNNGYIDDCSGWDVSDNDNDATLPEGREYEYYHGTAIAGIITGILKSTYGPDAGKFVKILPVKALSNQSGNTAILDGYDGVKYALSLNPDIICCAWSGGTPSDREKSIVEQADKKGIIIIASSGNFFAEKDEYPALLPGVWDIAATDSLNKKMPNSNYSMRVDFVVPGVNIKAPFPIADNSYFKPEGTSVSAAVMTGCAGIIKLAFPYGKKEIIEEALKNTAIPVDSINIRYCGKLGTGIPDIQKALEYLSQPENRFRFQNPRLTKGTLVFNTRIKEQLINVSPHGTYSGIFLHIQYSIPDKIKGFIKIFNSDTVLNKQLISQLPKSMYIRGSSFGIEINAPSKTLKNLKIDYYFKTIDSTRLFCNGIKYYRDTAGEFTDGSRSENYANNCSCKWLIIAPAGKRIKFEFSEFDTQAKTDFVWLFDGEAAIPENIIAKFSGPDIPPAVTSGTNKVLVWFVTDENVTGKGWKLKYTLVD